VTNTFIIDIEDDTFVKMENCSMEEYKSESRPEKCDYQEAKCTYNDNQEQACEVRRKGSSTWRDMRGKASFKVKHDDKVNFGAFACGEVCPLGVNENVWNTKKVTLNNMVFTTNEVDAYETFRKIGKRAVPLAQYATVVLKIGGVTVREDTYAMIETIDDKEFAKKWFGSNYALWEVDIGEEGGFKFERGGGAVEDAIDAGNLTLPNLLDPPRSKLAGNDSILYYIGEKLTGHWDSLCVGQNPNNYYMAYDTRAWTIIPSGLDNTFQGGCGPFAFIYLLRHGYYGKPTCSYMQECLESEECKGRYEDHLEVARDTDMRKISRTCVNGMTLVLSAISVLSSGAVVLISRAISIRIKRR